MKIVMHAPANSVHTKKWVEALQNRGHDLLLVTAHEPAWAFPGVRIERLPFSPPLGYFCNHWHLRKLLNQFHPDLLHTQSASGYGLTGRLTGFQPHLLSVWGSDVFSVPDQSVVHARIIKSNLSAAFQIASTSSVMKRRSEELILPRRDIKVTPFGVDTARFYPGPHTTGIGPITLGTIKGLHSNYGIDTLIRTFGLLKERFPGELLLKIAGVGPQEKELKALALALNLEKDINFLGQVQHADVPALLRSFDVFLALSNQESFGVAVLEASACGIPVVASRVGGLPEVVVDGLTGCLVPPADPMAAAEVCLRLIQDHALREALGKGGREWVLASYDWDICVDTLEGLYKDTIQAWASISTAK